MWRRNVGTMTPYFTFESKKSDEHAENPHQGNQIGGAPRLGSIGRFILRR
jgi:hypothetical protein